MEVDVTTMFAPIDFGATGVKEILQNVRMILTTPEYSCPMDRGFAWDPEILDAPMNIAHARIAHRLVEAVRKYESRAKVVKVMFQGNQDGVFKPTVRVRINEDAI